jgi:protein-tyrosine phosphatase
VAADFARFDLVLAMDRENLRNLQRLAAGRPAQIALFRSFDPTAGDGAEVPDPWYGGADGFETVLDQCERACAGLLAHVRARLTDRTP